MTHTTLLQAHNPLILRSGRLMEAFAKSDDERDFYLDRQEGFIVYVDLDQSQEYLDKLEEEFKTHHERYCMIPKMSFYDSKKIMEGFIHEKVYDIDTKEKLMDIIQAKEARENFLEFLYDHHNELEKWLQYYQEKSRVRIIEWLRNNHFHFVFEEDLDVGVNVIEKLKTQLFEEKVPKDIQSARKALAAKAKTYYSSEALNPRPKRGRPPKQAQKAELEPQISVDIYTSVPSSVRPFLFTPDLTHVSPASFSSKFESNQDLQNRKHSSRNESESVLENLNLKLIELRKLSSKWLGDIEPPPIEQIVEIEEEDVLDFDFEDKPKDKKKK